MEEMSFKDFSREENRIYKKNCAVYYKLATNYGLTETMFDILYFVRENVDCSTQAQLCSNLYLRKQTVNSALKKLEKEGYIYLSKKSGNQKNKTIHFTEKGEERRAFERLTEEERRGILYYGLKQIETLEKEAETYIQTYIQKEEK